MRFVKTRIGSGPTRFLHVTGAGSSLGTSEETIRNAFGQFGVVDVVRVDDKRFCFIIYQGKNLSLSFFILFLLFFLFLLRRWTQLDYVRYICTVLHHLMTFNTVLSFNLLYCIALHCSQLCYTMLYCSIVYCSVLYCTVLSCSYVLNCAVRYCTSVFSVFLLLV